MPAWSETTRVYGQIVKLEVEQIGKREALHCQLAPEDGSDTAWYFTYLDVGATVALAQLQLLREAITKKIRVRLNYVVETISDTDYRHFYNVRIYSSPEVKLPVTKTIG